MALHIKETYVWLSCYGILSQYVFSQDIVWNALEFKPFNVH